MRTGKKGEKEDQQQVNQDASPPSGPLPEHYRQGGAQKEKKGRKGKAGMAAERREHAGTYQATVRIEADKGERVDEWMVAVGIAGGQRILGQRVYRGLLIVCGVFLFGLGAWFLWTGADRAVG